MRASASTHRQVRKILAYVSKHSSIGNREVQALLSIGGTRAKDLLGDMSSSGLLVREGVRRSTRYVRGF